MKQVEQVKRISVLRSETRKLGDNYMKLEFAAEDNLLPDSTWEDSFKALDRVVRTALEAAMAVTSIQRPSETSKPVQPQVPAKSEHPPISGDDPYASLPWRQSQKKQNLSTIRVTPEILANPQARELYDRLKEWKTMKVGKVSYRYSQMENGTEFLQQWRAVAIG
jgi:hypothetical protein